MRILGLLLLERQGKMLARCGGDERMVINSMCVRLLLHSRIACFILLERCTTPLLLLFFRSPRWCDDFTALDWIECRRDHTQTPASHGTTDDSTSCMLMEPDHLRLDLLGLAWLPCLGFCAQDQAFCSALTRSFVPGVVPETILRVSPSGARFVLLYWEGFVTLRRGHAGH